MKRSPSASVYGPRKSRRTGPASSKKRKNMSVLALTRSPKANIGFPAMMNMKHFYVENINLLGQISSSLNRFSVNGMFDPNQSGVGHQPHYFDQMVPLYNHYCVIDTYAKFTIKPAGIVAQQNVTVSCYLNDDTSGLNLAGTREQPTSKNIVIGGIEGAGGVIIMKWNPYTNYGPAPLANDQLQGTSSSNPFEQAYFEIIARASDEISAYSVDIMCEFYYTAVWTERKDVNNS